MSGVFAHELLRAPKDSAEHGDVERARPSLAPAPVRQGIGATLFELLKYVAPHRKYAVLTLAFGALGFVLSFAYPWIIGNVIDLVASPAAGVPLRERQQRVHWLTGGAVLTAVLQAAVVYGRGHFNVQLGHAVVVDLRQALFNHLQRLSVLFFTKERTGSVLSRLLQDAHEATSLIYMGVMVAGLDAVQLLIAAVLLFSISWKLTAVCLALFPLYGLVFRFFNPRVRHASDRMHAQLAHIVGNVTEQLGGQADVPERPGHPGEHVEEGVRAGGGGEQGADEHQRDEVDRHLDPRLPAARPPLVGADHRGDHDRRDESARGAVPRHPGDELQDQGDAEGDQRGPRAVREDDQQREDPQQEELEPGGCAVQDARPRVVQPERSGPWWAQRSLAHGRPTVMSSR